MADSNQNSQATTDSQAPTSDDFGVHSDEIVPKQIANHDKTLLASVRADGEWININDTLQMNNRQKDLHRVHNEVVEAQKGIVDAKAAADDATRKADSAVQTAQVTSDTVANMSGAISDATSGAAAAVSQAKDALSKADATKTELQASINSNSKAIELKADKTTVDAVSGTVKENSASIDVLNGQIKQAVTSSTIDGLLDKKGYATQTYTQDLVKQTSDTWGVNLSKLESKVDDNHKLDVKQMTDVQTSIDGIQGTVVDNEKKTESRFTQLADGFQSKVFDAINDSTTKGAAFNNKYTTLTGVVDLNAITATGNYYIDGQLVNSPYPDDGNNGHTVSGHFIFMVFYEGDASAFGKDKGKYYPHEQIYREGDSGLYNRYTDNWDWPDGSSTLKVDAWKDWYQDAQSSITQLKDDINWKVSNGDLISQINMEAGRTLIQSDKLYLDAKSVVFGKDTKAFIPNAAITDLSADKVTAGTLKGITLEVDDAQEGKPATQKTYIADGKISTNSIDVTGDNANLPAITLGPKMYWATSDAVLPSFSIGITDGLRLGYSYEDIRTFQAQAIPENNLLTENTSDENSVDESCDMWTVNPIVDKENPPLEPQYNLADGDILMADILLNYVNPYASTNHTSVQMFLRSGSTYYYASQQPQQLLPGVSTYHFEFPWDSQSTDDMVAGLVFKKLPPKGKVYFSLGNDYEGNGALVLMRQLPLDSDKRTSDNDTESFLLVKPDGTLTSQYWSQGNNVVNQNYSVRTTMKNGSMRFLYKNTISNSTNDESTPGANTGGLDIDAYRGITFYQDYVETPRINFTGNQTYNDYIDSIGTKGAISDSANNGIYFDGYGNIHAHGGSWAWKIKDSNSNDVFIVPTDGKGDFHLNTKNDGKVIIGGGHLDDASNGNVTHQLTNLMVENLHVTHWFGVDKYKNRVVETSQGHLGINAYETAEPYFGDIGESDTGDAKQVVVGIDRIFSETINTSMAYQVFLQSYSSAHVWVAKRYPNRFVVESDQPNAPFGWEFKARQKGYEHTRLQNMDNMPNV